MSEPCEVRGEFGSSAPMTEQEIRCRMELVEEHIRVENAQQMDELIDTFSQNPHFVLNSQRTDGRDGVQQLYADLFRGFPDLKSVVKSQYVSREGIVLETVLSGTHRAEWNGIPATGRSVEVPMCAIFPFNEAEGKLEAEIVYFDGTSLLRQLGLLPPQ